MEGLAHADGPSEGNDGHAEFAFDLIHHIQRRLHLAVHLVDKRQDGGVPSPADLQQTAGLRLYAVGGINHHERGINRRQDAVGILRKILVTGCVQQINDAIAVFHLHH